MTCIIGIKDEKNNRVIIGADSAGTSGGSLIKRSDEKVFKNGDFLFGCAGDFRMLQIVRYAFIPPPIGSGEDLEKYLCTTFVTALRECFIENGFAQTYAEGNARGPYFVLGYKDRIFQIEDDFQIAIHKNGIHSIGSGREYAYGAMHILKDLDLTTKEKVKRTLKASAYYATTVDSPFIIKTT